MAIRKFRTGQQSYNVSTYVGTYGTIFYDEEERILRVSDGITPGGIPITPTTLVGVTEPTVAAVGQLWFNPTTFELWCYHNGEFKPTIDVATETKLGGVKLGPGVTTNAQGQIIIDSTGLGFSFGDFAADGNRLQTINLNQDAIFLSNGTGAIRAVGEFYIHPTDGSTADYTDEPYIFGVKTDGQVEIFVSNTDNTAGAVEIIGSSTGNIIAPGQPGAMLHLTGQPSEQCRFYMDGNGNYASIVGRRWNGTVASPTQVLANEDILRINATAATDAGVGGVALAQIAFTALENQTTTAQGSEIGFTVTPVGQPTANRAKVLKVDGVGVTTDRLVKARNYEGAVRNAGSVGGTTVTLDWATDHMVHCTFTDNFTVAFSNYTAGRTITLIATNTSGFDSDIITAGISAVNTQGDNTLTITEQTTAIITYYCTGTTVASVYASAVYA